MYKIAICDDEEDYRKTLRSIIENNQEIFNTKYIIYEYTSGEELIGHVDILHDLIFIDIRMPGIDGNKTANLLRGINNKAVLVFCSNYFEPTVESINIGQPFRYIMKEANDLTLKREMKDILLEMKKGKIDPYLTITSTGKILRILLRKILYLSVLKRGACIYIINKNKVEEIRSKESVKELYKTLKNNGFEYAHNSYIVNMENVIGIEKSVVLLKCGIQLNISRSKKNLFEERLIDYLKGENNFQ